MPATPESVIAFDFGLRRIGVAVGQQVTASASPLGIVRCGPSGPEWREIARLVEEWRPTRLVVGIPSRQDGSKSDIDSELREFIDALARFGLPIEEIDERHTSVEASARLKSARSSGQRGRVQKAEIDAAAAALIAERWLNREH